MIEEIKKIQGVHYAKEIKSTTKAKAVHVKINKVNYQVVTAPIPRLYDQMAAHTAIGSGRIKDYANPIFKYRGTDLVEGVKKLADMLLNEHNCSTCKLNVEGECYKENTKVMKKWYSENEIKSIKENLECYEG